jgi:uncharacterized protein involved in type VI secretion and phage assembly
MAAALEGLASRLIEQLAGRFRQHRRVLRLSTPAGKDALLAESLRGDEGVDTGFRFHVAALALDAGIPLRTLIGQPVLVELQTSDPSGQPRCFHGHATAVEQVGANGGFARYLLTIEPWTAFLALGRDSRVFQDKSVFDILDTVFKAYDGKGQLAPAWRFDIRDCGLYPRRSLTTQYQESDLAFAMRLMNEEGLFFFFEHEQGGHTLVIADHNDAFTPNAQTDVRYTQPGAVMREDSLDRWRSELRLQTNTVEIGSWDYRARTRRDVASSASPTINCRACKPARKSSWARALSARSCLAPRSPCATTPFTMAGRARVSRSCTSATSRTIIWTPTRAPRSHGCWGNVRWPRPITPTSHRASTR